MPFEFLDEIAAADAAFRAWGRTVEEMFVCAAEAAMNVMVEDLEKIRRLERRDIRVGPHPLDMLLFNLLQEIIFYKDAEQLLLRIEGVRIKPEAGPPHESVSGGGPGAPPDAASGLYSLEAAGRGERIDPGRHDLIVDVKAVTLHKFKVERTSSGWETFIILDI